MLKDIIPANIEIRSQISKIPPVLGDSNKLMQVITNLCINSSHAISEIRHNGLIIITLNTFLPDPVFLIENPGFENQAYARLAVDDNGCGIAKENLSKIFDPFFSTKTKGCGTGLGLSTVYGIISEFNGKITVDSMVGHGSTFGIYLPLLKSQQEVDAVEISVLRPILPVFNASVLLVYDEELLVEINTLILKEIGLTVHGFTDPEFALDCFKNNHKDIDLIITDFSMPKLNGHVLLKQIRKIKKIPALICSGQESELFEQDDELVSNYFLLKPIMFNGLVSSIGQILSWKNILFLNANLPKGEDKNLNIRYKTAVGEFEVTVIEGEKTTIPDINRHRKTR